MRVGAACAAAREERAPLGMSGASRGRKFAGDLVDRAVCVRRGFTDYAGICMPRESRFPRSLLHGELVTVTFCGLYTVTRSGDTFRSVRARQAQPSVSLSQTLSQARLAVRRERSSVALRCMRSFRRLRLRWWLLKLWDVRGPSRAPGAAGPAGPWRGPWPRGTRFGYTVSLVC